MAKRMLIDSLHPEETRVAIADENQIYDFDFVSTAKKQLKGNIYLAKITRVEPSLQAAFVEYGGGKQGFLPFAEIHADYYQIPMADRRRLMEEAEGEDESDDTPEAAAGEQTEQGEQNSGGDESDAPAGLEPSSEAEHPAYLTEGAIDVSGAEEPAHPPEDDAQPFARALESGAEMPIDAAHPGEATTEAPPENAGEDVETLASEEEEYRPKKAGFSKRYKIQEVIRRGQIVLIQVIKEERGNKGASLTTYLSLAGRYCVLMPNSPKDGGISRKIASGEDRKRLKAISTELRLARGMSVIIRTAGMDRTRAEIKRDYDYLVKVWNQIREDTLSSNAPALIYEESDIIKRAIRDQYSNDIDEVVIEGEAGYKSAKEFMKLLLPSHTPKIKHYKEATPLFYAYSIEDQLLSMHDPVVKLRSGGYIVINPTEALISVDVNSGRATAERNIEETATKTNIEAAAEVARQLRLRDLAGLIVIDFIDMMESRNRRAVEKTLKDSLKADRAKIQLGRISPFGLLEMSRQRLRPSISETNTMQCPHCIGRGVIRSNESMSIQAIRAIEKEASAGGASGLRLIAPQAVALHLLNTKRDLLRAIEQRYGMTVQVVIGTDMTTSDLSLEKVRKTQEGGRSEERRSRPERGERTERGERGNRDRDRERGRDRDRDRDREREREAPAEPAPAADENFEANDNQPREEGEGRRGRSRRGRRGRGRDGRPERTGMQGDNQSAWQPSEFAGEGLNGETPSDAMPESAANENAFDDQAPREGRPPRQRGGRGRRRWRERDGERQPGPEAAAVADDVPTSWHSDTDGGALPAFATEAPVPADPEPMRPEPLQAAESTPRDPNAPTKKGWWQKMIELDD